MSVITDYEECLKLVQELKLAAGKFKGCIKENEERAKESAISDRLEIKKRRCCKKALLIDAEELYGQEIEDLMGKIRRMEEDASRRNVGVCFVVFREAADAKKA